jgi:hypothetical protein
MKPATYILGISGTGEFMTIGTFVTQIARKYQTAADDIEIAASWAPSSEVQIRPSRSKEFPVRIYHFGNDETVKAVSLGLVPYCLGGYD